MKSFLVNNSVEESEILLILSKLGVEWIDGTSLRNWVPSIDSSEFWSDGGFPYVLTLDTDEWDLTWEWEHVQE